MDTLRHSLRQIAKAEMRADPAHDLAHLDRVWQNAQTLAQALEGANPRILIAAAYLHDLVNLPKHASDRALASRGSAALAEQHLPALGFSENEIAAISHAIEAHSFSAGIAPQSLEARILRDADRLDALGAVGIARWFAVSGALNRPFYDPDDPYAQTRAPDDTAFALDHWAQKLRHLGTGMLTEPGRALARARTAQMRQFLAAFGEDIGVPPPAPWLGA